MNKIQISEALSTKDLRQIAKLPFFFHVPITRLEILLGDVSVMTHPNEGLLFSHDDPVDYIYILLAGMVTISRYHEDGAQAIIETITPVRLFAEAAAFLQGHYPATAEYASGSRIISIPVAPFLKKLSASPQTAFSILGSLALREQELSAQLDTLKLHTPSQRLLQYFLEHIPGDVSGPHTLTLRHDKAVVAKKLGITPESLSRLLARFSQYGITSARRTVHIDNVGKVRSYLEASRKKV